MKKKSVMPPLKTHTLSCKQTNKTEGAQTELMEKHDVGLISSKIIIVKMLPTSH